VAAADEQKQMSAKAFNKLENLTPQQYAEAVAKASKDNPPASTMLQSHDEIANQLGAVLRMGAIEHMKESKGT